MMISELSWSGLDLHELSRPAKWWSSQSNAQSSIVPNNTVFDQCINRRSMHNYHLPYRIILPSKAISSAQSCISDAVNAPPRGMGLTKLSIRPKISNTVATTSKHNSSCSSFPPPAPGPAGAPVAISFLTSLTNSCTLSLPTPPEPPSLFLAPPPMVTGPAESEVPKPNGHVENSARISSHRAKAASRES